VCARERVCERARGEGSKQCARARELAVVINYQLVIVIIGHSLSHVSRGSIHDRSQSHEKISNSSSFGIIDIADHSSTTDRIIVIVKTACFIHDGACR